MLTKRLLEGTAQDTKVQLFVTAEQLTEMLMAVTHDEYVWDGELECVECFRAPTVSRDFDVQLV